MAATTDKPWLKLYSPGDPSEITAEYETALEMFNAAVGADPDAPMLKYFDTTLSARTVDEATNSLAVALVNGGLRPGDRLALYLQNVPQYVLALVATWKAGAIAVSVNPMLKGRELRQILDDSKAAVLVCMDDLRAGLDPQALEGSTVTRVITTSALDFQTRDDPRVFAKIKRVRTPETDDLLMLLDRFSGQVPDRVALRATDIAVITYTSGTTGVPKGATNTHGNVVVGGQTYRDWFKLGPRDTLLGIAPLFHVTGLSGHIATALSAKMPLVLIYRFDLGVVLDAIREHRPTFTVGAITVFIALTNDDHAMPDDLASLRVIASGGAPIPPATVEQFRAKFGTYIHNVYGMTETTSPTHSVPLGAEAPVDPRSGALSVGVPVYSCDMWVVDEAGAELPAGQIGELVVAGPRIVPGYWNKPAETAAAFRDGRLFTGDVGFIDDDGWFFIVDRKKDVIIASGYKVWPRDVEDVLYGHEAVLEAAVVGVPDDYRGESVKAFVSLKPGASASESELIAFCKERMAAYKYPRSVEIVDQIPKTVTGKILRKDLRPVSERRA